MAGTCAGAAGAGGGTAFAGAAGAGGGATGGGVAAGLAGVCPWGAAAGLADLFGDGVCARTIGADISTTKASHTRRTRI